MKMCYKIALLWCLVTISYVVANTEVDNNIEELEGVKSVTKPEQEADENNNNIMKDLSFGPGRRSLVEQLLRHNHENMNNLPNQTPEINEIENIMKNLPGFVPEKKPVKELLRNFVNLKTVPKTDDNNIRKQSSVPVRSKRSVINSGNCAYGEKWFLVACIPCEEYEDYTGESC